MSLIRSWLYHSFTKDTTTGRCTRGQCTRYQLTALLYPCRRWNTSWDKKNLLLLQTKLLVRLNQACSICFVLSHFVSYWFTWNYSTLGDGINSKECTRTQFLPRLTPVVEHAIKKKCSMNPWKIKDEQSTGVEQYLCKKCWRAVLQTMTSIAQKPEKTRTKQQQLCNHYYSLASSSSRVRSCSEILNERSSIRLCEPTSAFQTILQEIESNSGHQYATTTQKR